MTGTARPRRAGTAGVTLIEMLVVLALFGIVAGAVVLAVPGDRVSARAELAAAAWTHALQRTADAALVSGEGFGLRFRDGALTFVSRNADGQWAPHTDAELGAVKLFPNQVRSSGQADPIQRPPSEVYAVSADLVPTKGVAHQARFGSELHGVTIWFDGATVRVIEGEKAADDTVR